MKLQVAMGNPESSTHRAADYRGVAIVLGAVIVAHLVLLAIALSARNSIVERQVEPRTITALLLSPEPSPPVVSPAAPPTRAAVVPPAPTPPVTRPAARVKPVPQPRAQVPRSVETPRPKPSASRESSAQPVTQTAVPETAAAAAPSAASAPAAHPAVRASSEPRNVSHVDCSIPKPDYPDISKRRGEHGTAIVRFVVGLSGHIETAQLQTSSGSARLDDAALAAVHAGACQPYTENGTPLRAAYSQSFVFGLTE